MFSIENAVGSGLLTFPEGVVVNRRFTARLDRHPATGLSVELEVEVDRAGRPHCRAVRLAADPNSDTFEDSITTARWRALPLATLVQQAFRAALVPIREIDSSDGEFTFEIDPEADQALLDAIAPQGATRQAPRADHEFEALAEFYRRAAARGANPTKLLADRFNVDRSTARRWITKAVEREFLAPDERLDQASGARAKRRS